MIELAEMFDCNVEDRLISFGLNQLMRADRIRVCLGHDSKGRTSKIYYIPEKRRRFREEDEDGSEND